MTDRIIAISQARMTSSRLPGKILEKVCGRTLLDYHLSRLSRSRLIDRLVVATTVNSADDSIAEFCRSRDVACVRGSEHDVLARYFQVTEKFPADIIVRVTSDCPLIDPDLLDQVVRYFLDHRDHYDYVTLKGEDFPRGLDVEVFSYPALAKAFRYGHLPHEREHVTPYIYRRDSEYRCGYLPSVEKLGHHRWCVDEAADLDLVSRILTAFGGRDDFSWRECLTLLDNNPAWLEINHHVRQKTLPG
ncbi:MAG: NTP transferase domain-containing protein [Alphaproteobacteria bacterium]|nr:NTP transferase domain-containing protein [Alphaproteobacteria bacterium]